MNIQPPINLKNLPIPQQMNMYYPKKNAKAGMGFILIIIFIIIAIGGGIVFYMLGSSKCKDYTCSGNLVQINDAESIPGSTDEICCSERKCSGNYESDKDIICSSGLIPKGDSSHTNGSDEDTCCEIDAPVTSVTFEGDYALLLSNNNVEIFNNAFKSDLASLLSVSLESIIILDGYPKGGSIRNAAKVIGVTKNTLETITKDTIFFQTQTLPEVSFVKDVSIGNTVYDMEIKLQKQTKSETCEEGYTGLGCNMCDEGYFVSNESKCIKCPNGTTSKGNTSNINDGFSPLDCVDIVPDCPIDHFVDGETGNCRKCSTKFYGLTTSDDKNIDPQVHNPLEKGPTRPDLDIVYGEGTTCTILKDGWSGPSNETTLKKLIPNIGDNIVKSISDELLKNYTDSQGPINEELLSIRQCPPESYSAAKCMKDIDENIFYQNNSNEECSCWRKNICAAAKKDENGNIITQSTDDITPMEDKLQVFTKRETVDGSEEYVFPGEIGMGYIFSDEISCQGGGVFPDDTDRIGQKVCGKNNDEECIWFPGSKINAPEGKKITYDECKSLNNNAINSYINNIQPLNEDCGDEGCRKCDCPVDDNLNCNIYDEDGIRIFEGNIGSGIDDIQTCEKMVDGEAAICKENGKYKNLNEGETCNSFCESTNNNLLGLDVGNCGLEKQWGKCTNSSGGDTQDDNRESCLSGNKTTVYKCPNSADNIYHLDGTLDVTTDCSLIPRCLRIKGDGDTTLYEDGDGNYEEYTPQNPGDCPSHVMTTTGDFPTAVYYSSRYDCFNNDVWTEESCSLDKECVSGVPVRALDESPQLIGASVDGQCDSANNNEWIASGCHSIHYNDNDIKEFHTMGGILEENCDDGTWIEREPLTNETVKKESDCIIDKNKGICPTEFTEYNSKFDSTDDLQETDAIMGYEYRSKIDDESMIKEKEKNFLRDNTGNYINLIPPIFNKVKLDGGKEILNRDESLSYSWNCDYNNDIILDECYDLFSEEYSEGKTNWKKLSDNNTNSIQGIDKCELCPKSNYDGQDAYTFNIDRNHPKYELDGETMCKSCPKDILGNKQCKEPLCRNGYAFTPGEGCVKCNTIDNASDELDNRLFSYGIEKETRDRNIYKCDTVDKPRFNKTDIPYDTINHSYDIKSDVYDEDKYRGNTGYCSVDDSNPKYVHGRDNPDGKSLVLSDIRNYMNKPPWKPYNGIYEMENKYEYNPYDNNYYRKAGFKCYKEKYEADGRSELSPQDINENILIERYLHPIFNNDNLAENIYEPDGNDITYNNYRLQPTNDKTFSNGLGASHITLSGGDLHSLADYLKDSNRRIDERRETNYVKLENVYGKEGIANSPLGCVNNTSFQDAKDMCSNAGHDICNSFFSYNINGTGRVCFKKNASISASSVQTTDQHGPNAGFAIQNNNLLTMMNIFTINDETIEDTFDEYYDQPEKKITQEMCEDLCRDFDELSISGNQCTGISYHKDQIPDKNVCVLYFEELGDYDEISDEKLSYIQFDYDCSSKMEIVDCEDECIWEPNGVADGAGTCEHKWSSYKKDIISNKFKNEGKIETAGLWDLNGTNKCRTYWDDTNAEKTPDDIVKEEMYSKDVLPYKACDFNNENQCLKYINGINREYCVWNDFSKLLDDKCNYPLYKKKKSDGSYFEPGDITDDSWITQLYDKMNSNEKCNRPINNDLDIRKWTAEQQETYGTDQAVCNLELLDTLQQTTSKINDYNNINELNKKFINEPDLEDVSSGTPLKIGGNTIVRDKPNDNKRNITCGFPCKPGYHLERTDEKDKCVKCDDIDGNFSDQGNTICSNENLKNNTCKPGTYYSKNETNGNDECLSCLGDKSTSELGIRADMTNGDTFYSCQYPPSKESNTGISEDIKISACLNSNTNDIMNKNNEYSLVKGTCTKLTNNELDGLREKDIADKYIDPFYIDDNNILKLQYYQKHKRDSSDVDKKGEYIPEMKNYEECGICIKKNIFDKNMEIISADNKKDCELQNEGSNYYYHYWKNFSVNDKIVLDENNEEGDFELSNNDWAFIWTPDTCVNCYGHWTIEDDELVFRNCASDDYTSGDCNVSCPHVSDEKPPLVADYRQVSLEKNHRINSRRPGKNTASGVAIASSYSNKGYEPQFYPYKWDIDGDAVLNNYYVRNNSWGIANNMKVTDPTICERSISVSNADKSSENRDEYNTALWPSTWMGESMGVDELYNHWNYISLGEWNKNRTGPSEDSPGDYNFNWNINKSNTINTDFFSSPDNRGWLIQTLKNPQMRHRPGLTPTTWGGFNNTTIMEGYTNPNQGLGEIVTRSGNTQTIRGRNNTKGASDTDYIAHTNRPNGYPLYTRGTRVNYSEKYDITNFESSPLIALPHNKNIYHNNYLKRNGMCEFRKSGSGTTNMDSGVQRGHTGSAAPIASEWSRMWRPESYYDWQQMPSDDGGNLIVSFLNDDDICVDGEEDTAYDAAVAIRDFGGRKCKTPENGGTGDGLGVYSRGAWDTKLAWNLPKAVGILWNGSLMPEVDKSRYPGSPWAINKGYLKATHLGNTVYRYDYKDADSPEDCQRKAVAERGEFWNYFVSGTNKGSCSIIKPSQGMWSANTYSGGKCNYCPHKKIGNTDWQWNACRAYPHQGCSVLRWYRDDHNWNATVKDQPSGVAPTPFRSLNRNDTAVYPTVSGGGIKTWSVDGDTWGGHISCNMPTQIPTNVYIDDNELGYSGSRDHRNLWTDGSAATTIIDGNKDDYPPFNSDESKVDLYYKEDKEKRNSMYGWSGIEIDPSNIHGHFYGTNWSRDNYRTQSDSLLSILNTDSLGYYKDFKGGIGGNGLQSHVPPVKYVDSYGVGGGGRMGGNFDYAASTRLSVPVEDGVPGVCFTKRSFGGSDRRSESKSGIKENIHGDKEIGGQIWTGRTYWGVKEQEDDWLSHRSSDGWREARPDDINNINKKKYLEQQPKSDGYQVKNKDKNRKKTGYILMDVEKDIPDDTQIEVVNLQANNVQMKNLQKPNRDGFSYGSGLVDQGNPDKSNDPELNITIPEDEDTVVWNHTDGCSYVIPEHTARSTSTASLENAYGEFIEKTCRVNAIGYKSPTSTTHTASRISRVNMDSKCGSPATSWASPYKTTAQTLGDYNFVPEDVESNYSKVPLYSISPQDEDNSELLRKASLFGDENKNSFDSFSGGPTIVSEDYKTDSGKSNKYKLTHSDPIFKGAGGAGLGKTSAIQDGDFKTCADVCNSSDDCDGFTYVDYPDFFNWWGYSSGTWNHSSTPLGKWGPEGIIYDYKKRDKSGKCCFKKKKDDVEKISITKSTDGDAGQHPKMMGYYTPFDTLIQCPKDPVYAELEEKIMGTNISNNSKVERTVSFDDIGKLSKIEETTPISSNQMRINESKTLMGQRENTPVDFIKNIRHNSVCGDGTLCNQGLKEGEKLYELRKQFDKKYVFDGYGTASQTKKGAGKEAPGCMIKAKLYNETSGDTPTKKITSDVMDVHKNYALRKHFLGGPVGPDIIAYDDQKNEDDIKSKYIGPSEPHQVGDGLSLQAPDSAYQILVSTR